jgi:hypothetical protein
MDRRRLVAGLLAFGSLAFAVAGLVVWREMSLSWGTLAARCSGTLGCAVFPPQYRLHPLRAELLWAAASVTGLIAVGLTVRPYIGRERTLGASS